MKKNYRLGMADKGTKKALTHSHFYEEEGEGIASLTNLHHFALENKHIHHADNFMPCFTCWN